MPEMASDINSAMSGSHLWNLRPVDDRRPHRLAQVSERSSKSFRRRLTCGSFEWGFKRNHNEKHWQNTKKGFKIMLNSHSSPISIPAFQSFQSFFKNSHIKAVLLFPQRRAPRQTNLIQISWLRGEPLKKSFGLNPVPVLMGETDVKPTWKATIETVKPTKYTTIVIWPTVPELLSKLLAFTPKFT